MGRVDGRIAIVTGAAGGIGGEICRALGAEGATVIGVDVLPSERITTEVLWDAYWSLDITDDDSVRHVFDEIAERFGRIDILVNSAGITGPTKLAHEVTEAKFTALFDVNVKGCWLGTKHAVRHMLRAESGSIVNLSSIYGLVGGARIPLYHATKGAVRLMSKADAVSYAKSGIRVNSVHPGSIESELSKSLSADADEASAQYNQRMLESIPAGHRGTAADVAHGVVYLSSTDARFVTGTELVIDGGYTAV